MPVQVISTVPPEVLNQAAKHYLHNITEDTHVVNQTYRPYSVAGREPGERFATTIILAELLPMDLGDDKQVKTLLNAKEIADDVASRINHHIGANEAGSFLGVFSSPRAVPTESELLDAETRMETFFSEVVSAGDRYWEQYHNMNFISGLMIRAAKHKRLDRDWCATIRKQSECPGCGDSLKPGVAVCKSCGAVLDRDKAIALGILQMAAVAPASDEAPKHKAK